MSAHARKQNNKKKRKKRGNKGRERHIMGFPRRTFLKFAVPAAMLPALSRAPRAQTYPSRPVRMVVGFAAGGPMDIVARLMAQWLSERLGQQFVIENRAGGGGNIATEMVVTAPPDGYTLLVVSPSNTVNTTLYQKLNFNFTSDIAPVAGFIRLPNVMVVSPSFPAKTVPEFIAHAKANPGALNMGSAGNGTSQHIAGELFKMMAGVHMVHVPYRGAAPAMADLFGGRVHVMFGTTPASIEYIRAGKLRPLAVTTRARWDGLPDVPTIADFVPGYEASGWFGLGAPKDTPSEIVGILNKEINAGLADPKLKARLENLGGTVLVGSAADFGKLLADETEKWAKVVRFSGAKAD
jgi:tripartite-type tricarboxylate transporter receptor subunit TctC